MSTTSAPAAAPPSSLRLMLARVVRGLAVLLIAGIALQLFLAGVGAFGASSYEAHRTSGGLLHLIPLLMLLVALAGRLGRRTILLTLALNVVFMAQLELASSSLDPWLRALHPLNALLLLALTVVLARGGGGVAATVRG